MIKNRELCSGAGSRWLETCALVCVLLLVSLVSGCGPSEPPAQPVLEIPVTQVIQRDVPIPIEMVGQTLGSVDIPIRARVEGVLESMNFQEGRNVKAGDLLYTIDPRPFESKVVEAQGRLAEARTMLAKAKSDLGRIRPLAEMKAVSQQDLDSAVAQYEAAKGTVQAAEAQVEQAKIELSYTRITSPIDGRIGISEAKVGEFVGRQPNPVVLNFVSQTDPIRVRFSINEREYLRFARRFAELRGQAETAPREGEGLELILADSTLHPYPGQVVSYSAAIDPATGTFTLEADFPNPDNIVLAGQFARVRAVAEVRHDALLVPQRAVSELQGNYRVFVIRPDNTVELRVIEPGPRIDDLWLIDKGLEPGERVAVEGILRLQNGMTVKPVPDTEDTVASEDSGE
jgi:membrane fusion protein (multidrug efflux system)